MRGMAKQMYAIVLGNYVLEKREFNLSRIIQNP
jgi:hypothetical protein